MAVGNGTSAHWQPFSLFFLDQTVPTMPLPLNLQKTTAGNRSFTFV